jgi:hypothetical protein
MGNVEHRGGLALLGRWRLDVREQAADLVGGGRHGSRNPFAIL